MGELLAIGGLAIVAIWTVLLEIKARKDNRKWFALKTEARTQLTAYLAGNQSDARKNHAKWCVDRYGEICDKIAIGGLFDSKRNMLYAEHSTLLLEELKRIGFLRNRTLNSKEMYEG